MPTYIFIILETCFSSQNSFFYFFIRKLESQIMADSKRRNRTDVLKESVKEKVDHYRNLAKQQGLTTNDIDDCIMLALQAKRPTITKKVSQFWRKLAKVLIITAAILVFLVFIIANHKPSKRFVELLTYNTSYPLMRAVRLLSLPLARTVDLTGK